MNALERRVNLLPDGCPVENTGCAGPCVGQGRVFQEARFELAFECDQGGGGVLAALEQVDWRTPAVTVMSNVTGQPHDAADIDSIKRRLVEQLTSPVRWGDCMTWAIANIPGRFVETAPGKVLAGLMKRIDRSRKVQSCPKPA